MSEIEKIAKILDEADCVEDALFIDFDGMAKALINAGYGDVKQAVREFAEEFEKELYEIMTPVDDTDELDLDSDKVKDLLKKLVKEVCGE